MAGDARKPPIRSKKAKKQWKQFVKACVQRYGKTGSFWELHPGIPKVPITSWQIWNEQNNSNYFAPRPKPRAYAKLVRLARSGARSVNKHAKIVFGGMARKPDPEHSMVASRFLKKLYRVKGAKRLFNVAAVHPYSPTVRDLKRQMSALHKVIKRHHDNARMWITEVGWGSAPPSKKWPLAEGCPGSEANAGEGFPRDDPQPQALGTEARLLVPVARRAPGRTGQLQFLQVLGPIYGRLPAQAGLAGVPEPHPPLSGRSPIQ